MNDLLDFRALIAILVLSVAAQASLAQGAPDAAYTVKPGDVLEIAVWKEPELQGPVLVRPDGHVAWRGDQVPADAAGLVDTVRGARV